MDEIRTSLRENFQDFLNSAERDFQEGKYNPAISSYFKAIAILCDYFIYQERRLLPKNHRERFLFLEMNWKEAYELISPLFNEYTDSYNLRIRREQAARVRTSVEKLKKIFCFEEKMD
ncbi:MAG TPA: hypothetical protein VJI32_03265 [Candidatus Nanoarchaeia archaeon]|nr:hypothetical protein [Candidatus Nanoarchaeia archaeon]